MVYLVAVMVCRHHGIGPLKISVVFWNLCLRPVYCGQRRDVFVLFVCPFSTASMCESQNIKS